MPCSQAWNASSVGAQSPSLPPNANLSSAVRFIRLRGNGSVNELWKRNRDCKFDKLPNSAGIAPVNALLRRDILSRLVRLPNSTGMLPDSELL